MFYIYLWYGLHKQEAASVDKNIRDFFLLTANKISYSYHVTNDKINSVFALTALNL